MFERRGLVAVLVLCAAGVVAYGSRGALGLFIEPWEEAFGETRGVVSLVSAVGFIVFAIAQPVAGRLLEIREARFVIASGLGMMAVGFGTAAFAPNVWVVLVLIGVVAAFGVGLTSLSALSYVGGELVSQRQGLVFGFLTAAGAGGQVVVLPVASLALGVSLSTSLLSIGVLCALAAVTVLMMVPSIPKSDAVPFNARRKVLVRHPQFWRLLVPFFICGFSTTGLIDTHFIPYALDQGMTSHTASLALSTLAAFNVAGVLVAGSFTDRADRSLMLTGLYITRAAILLLLPLMAGQLGIFVFAVVFGLSDFATVPPTTSLTRSAFPVGWGLAIGVISAGHQFGSALGAAAGGWLYDLTGTYQTVLIITSALLLFGAWLTFRMRGTETNLARSQPRTPSRG